MGWALTCLSDDSGSIKSNDRTILVDPAGKLRASMGTSACIGVFDSGVGGLSVLKALRDRMPSAPLLYVADSAHAPYGERGDAYVQDRSRLIVAHLVACGAVGVVVACNTATAASILALRQEWTGLEFIGVEPGLKPAAAASRNGRVGVMATAGTLASAKFQALLRAQPAHVSVVARPCPGLARLIEEGDLDAPALRAEIDGHASALRASEVDTVVLGCTHYTFVQHHIEAALSPQVRVVDTAYPVARHAMTRLDGLLGNGDATGSVTRLQTTGNVERLRRIAAAWLPFQCRVEEWSPVDA